MKRSLRVAFCALTCLAIQASAQDTKPNVIIYFTDDISAREFPIYGSNVWTDPYKNNTQDLKYRAETPVMDRLAEDGCWIETAWAATVCSPSRAMMMTGRHAHLHKWWHNKEKGQYIDESGKRHTWPLYESSPLQMGHLAQQAGYGTYWASKTQMAGDLRNYGYDEGCFTPGNLSDTDNPYTDFKMAYQKVDGKRELINLDTGKPVNTYQQHGWYWFPHVRLMNDPAADGFSWWPNSPESEAAFGLSTYGPDVEMDFIFNFMDRQQAAGKPFFVYHSTHLGHAGFDFFSPEENGQCWVGTPIIEWDGEKYTRTEPHVTGDNGVYDTHGTVTETGMHTHVNYIDFQIWQYLEKLKDMGLDQNTILIIASDNGSSGYGKDSPDRQKGTHVPFIVYAPGFETTKQGKQEVLLSLADVLPTLADIMDVEIPEDYEVNGESFWTWLTTDQVEHRDWIYAYRKGEQLVRGKYVMKDGWNRWYDVSGEEPDDMISYPEIKNWKKVSDAHRAERDLLLETIKQYARESTTMDAPGTPPRPEAAKPKNKNKQKG